MTTTMDLTNILNTKEAAASGLTQLQTDPSQRYQEFNRTNHYQVPRVTSQGAPQALPYTYQPRSPTPPFLATDNVAESPASDRSMSSSAYSIHSGPSSELMLTQSVSMSGPHTISTMSIDSIGAQRGPGRPPTGDPSSKSFPCSVCSKGFARRSDLARHERIHTGVRPHVCDHPGCNKQFIQRSALTVHARVHTGEKPHMCETCGKAFSDSSSLARHRRIHSGKRPYKCPYADCQKTFTRRTTLTRHQNHHTGTIGEAAAATAAALAARPTTLPRLGRPSRSPTDGDPNVDAAMASVAMMSHSTSLISPTHDMGNMMPLHRQEYSHQMWRAPTDSNDYQVMTPRPTLSAASSSTSIPNHRPMPQYSHSSHHHRVPSATSHPQNYLPSLPSLSTAPRRSISPHGSEYHNSNQHVSNPNSQMMHQHWQSQYHHQNGPLSYYPSSTMSPRLTYP